MGNLNINLFNPPNINAIDDYLQDFLALNFKPLMLYPTRIHRDDNNEFISYSLIDHIFINIDQKSYSHVIQYELTDHFPIVSFVSLEEIINEQQTCIIRSKTYRKINNFSDSLQRFVSDFRLIENDPDRSFTLFAQQLYQIYYNCFPQKTVKIKKDRCTYTVDYQGSKRMHKKEKHPLFSFPTRCYTQVALS